MHPDKYQPLGCPVSLDNLVGNASQTSPDFAGVHDEFFKHK
jgi:hypothetical protein